MANLIALDLATPLVNVDKDGKTDGNATVLFAQRWREISDRLDDSPVRIGTPVQLPGTQNASILSTPLGQALAAGLYRVSWYARIVTPDAVSSSLQIVIGWTESSIALSLQGAAITGNLVTSVQSGIAPLLQIDNGSPITYGTVYASNTPGAMKYLLTVALERVA